MNAPIHLVDDPKIDEIEDSEIAEFINKGITCTLPDKTKYLKINNLVKKVLILYHATIYRKKKAVQGVN